jgi:hypothetical protein
MSLSKYLSDVEYTFMANLARASQFHRFNSSAMPIEIRTKCILFFTDTKVVKAVFGIE